MGQITRHSGFPFADTETLSGTDLEADIAAIVTVVNSDIDTANIATAAGIVNAQLAASTLTTARMNASAVPKAAVSTQSAQVVLTTATTYVDITGITDISVTPGSSNDIIMMWYQADYESGTSGGGHRFTFSVDGTTLSQALQVAIQKDNGDPNIHINIHYAVAAGSTTAQVIKPQVRADSTSDAGTLVTGLHQVFSVLVVPIK